MWDALLKYGLSPVVLARLRRRLDPDLAAELTVAERSNDPDKVLVTIEKTQLRMDERNRKRNP